MQARLIAYPPHGAALVRWIEPDERLRIGRASDSDLRLDHPSVSRAHAELSHDGTAWRLRDLDSKNGSFADGLVTRDDRLPPACWLRFGDVHCEFAEFDDDQATLLRGREQQRRNLSAVRTHQVAGQTQFDSLLDEVLRGVVDLAGCSRGFLLLADGADYAVSASLVIDPKALDRRSFSGSVGAVQRTLSEGKPVVVNHVGSEAWLAERASIVGTGLQTLVCLPLRDGDRVFGAVYADRREPGEAITEFDLELLGAFAETATLWLLARRALQTLDDAPRWSTIVHAQATGTELSGDA
ncbi:MAG: GAF domain-containing protein [Lysobacter sp.]